LLADASTADLRVKIVVAQLIPIPTHFSNTMAKKSHIATYSYLLLLLHGAVWVAWTPEGQEGHTQAKI